VDGLMLINPDVRDIWVTELASYTRHVIMIDPAQPTSLFRTVIFDNTQAVRLAMAHLYELGHRRIGFLGSCLANPTMDSQCRLDAYLTVASEMGLTVEPQWVHAGHDPLKPLDCTDHYCQIEGIRGAKRMLQLPIANRPTALLAYNDLVAVYAVRHLTNELSIPAQMSVVGIDDSEWCFHVEPNLTSVRHPLEQMGSAAVNWLVGQLETQHTTEQTQDNIRIFMPELILRKSTGKPV
jgi:LacI family transcriptional regulator